MQKFSKEKLYPMQQQTFDIINKNGGRLVASVEDIAKMLPRRRRKLVGKSSVKYALDALVKKEKIKIIVGASHQKSEFIIIEK